MSEIGEHNLCTQRCLGFLSAYTYTLEYCKGSANANVGFFSRSPLPATEQDRTGADRLIDPDGVAVYIVRFYAPTAVYTLECHPDGRADADDVLRAPGSMARVAEPHDWGHGPPSYA